MTGIAPSYTIITNSDVMDHLTITNSHVTDHLTITNMTSA